MPGRGSPERLTGSVHRVDRGGASVVATRKRRLPLVRMSRIRAVITGSCEVCAVVRARPNPSMGPVGGDLLSSAILARVDSSG